MRQVGTAAIFVCLQHKEITAEKLLKIVETNFMNSCYRLMGLELLEFTLTLINKTKTEKPCQDSLMAVRNVTAALHFGIRLPMQLNGQSHYLDGISSCGESQEGLIRASFFNVLQGVSDFFTHVGKSELLELVSCLDWSFKARDF